MSEEFDDNRVKLHSGPDSWQYEGFLIEERVYRTTDANEIPAGYHRALALCAEMCIERIWQRDPDGAYGEHRFTNREARTFWEAWEDEKLPALEGYSFIDYSSPYFPGFIRFWMNGANPKWSFGVTKWGQDDTPYLTIGMA